MPKRSRRRTSSNPATTRRVQARRAGPRRALVAPSDADAHMDGCDIDFKDSPMTADADLPQASGGVELIKRAPGKRRKRR